MILHTKGSTLNNPLLSVEKCVPYPTVDDEDKDDSDGEGILILI